MNLTQAALLGRLSVGLLLLLGCGRILLGSRGVPEDAGPSDSPDSGGPVRDGGLDVGARDASVPMGAGGRDGGSAGPVAAAPSCRADPRCGDAALSCCATRSVPGGTFDFQLRAAQGTASRTTVSSFDLDVFEVTVGRFREFVADYDRWRPSGNPLAVAGADASTPAGWQSAWSDALPSDSAALQQGLLRCDTSPYSSWAGASDDLPMNCVSWFEASAFCAWDGGRLPTDAEWEYAAVGGAEQRLYPWGNTPEPQPALALFGCDFEAGCMLSDLSGVGSHAPGAGRWGQQDLAGSLAEWLDTVSSPVLDNRAFRGGSWIDDASALRIEEHVALPPAVHLLVLGFRCARQPA